MALKTKDGTFDSKPANFERDTHPAGINFQLPDQRQLFAPYSFLSHAKMYKEEEIVIHYTFGVVRVKGGHLGKIYSILCNHELAAINCDAERTTNPGETHIRETEFEEIEPISV
jgi:hypothetical protein